MRIASLAPLAMLVATAGCHHDDAPSAGHAWVRLAAVPGRPAAAYLTVHAGPAPVRLIAIDSEAAGSSELHESMKTGSMDSMKRLDGIDLPAHGDVVFAPGGTHVMLFGVGPQVKPGDTIPLSVLFARGDPLKVTAKVVAAGGDAPY